jgi:hypothetical protein
VWSADKELLRVDKHELPNGEHRFYQHHWNGTRWLYGIKGTYAERKIPYRLPELKAALMANPDTEVHIAEGAYRLPELKAALMANPDTGVHIAEGEKDAGTLARLGFIATTNPGGALSWTEDLTAWFRWWRPGQQARRHCAYCKRSHSPLAGH